MVLSVPNRTGPVEGSFGLRATANICLTTTLGAFLPSKKLILQIFVFELVRTGQICGGAPVSRPGSLANQLDTRRVRETGAP